jgi:hypothetical protein
MEKNARIKSFSTRSVTATPVEFFMDYLLRKVMVKPPQYTHWPPALRLFHRFLAEKGYLDDPEPRIERLHAIEPNFIALVKRRS